jgi:hypothetical protein
MAAAGADRSPPPTYSQQTTTASFHSLTHNHHHQHNSVTQASQQLTTSIALSRIIAPTQPTHTTQQLNFNHLSHATPFEEMKEWTDAPVWLASQQFVVSRPIVAT